ncbi:MAG: discoidin domain-containing protein [Paramuribaculum sp.]|nr:discoidin domain-containing protein [Paramuribaculum sp.]
MKLSCFYLSALAAVALATSHAGATTSIASSVTEQHTPDAISITGATRINPTTIELKLSDGKRFVMDFYGDNIFRLFRDDNSGIIRNPIANPPADILVKNPRKHTGEININDQDDKITVSTPKIAVEWNKADATMSVTDRTTGKTVVSETSPVRFEKGKTVMTLAEKPNEYFYGGGVQNGRFSHKGRTIAIENQNSWTDGGVASPTPYYWSTNGYGIMFHTFGKGKYDFGSETPGTVKLTHDTDYLDAFVMVSPTPAGLLNDFYQLTGNPVLLPKFGFYEGHLNAYNRDYWKEDEKGILFEDGKRYKESQRDNGGIKESLNGEKNNYQFSARAVVDRYAAHDMPLGWVLPNDGYGAGYGQTETLDGNIENLRQFGDYARSKGVEIGLWTQSNLHPNPEVSALLQRDIVKEVRDAGVRVLKTDVAWVGAGYSFGLNGVADVGEIMPYYGNDARPFIISLDGWAGTQRYAGVWSGDQTGGEWEYIRFHIPTYIGSGLSGQPNITSDMDGIFGGLNPAVNIRDFQWKTFSPMQLNMDGWGRNEKYPHALGEPSASINRNYLKLKSQLLPYAYTYAREAIDGKPLIRAMFLDYPNDYTHSAATRYQYLYGPDFLVAPIYQNTAADSLGNDIRNGIYLPEGNWIDYFSGDRYEGNIVLNSFATPIWKLPVFVKAGAIIPMVNPNNNPMQIDRSNRIFEFYPDGKSEFTLYDDDGTTESYRDGKSFATTTVTSTVLPKSLLNIYIAPTEGSFEGFTPDQSTELIVNVTSEPKAVTARIGNSKVTLKKVTSQSEFESNENVYYYNPAPELNRFSTPGSEASNVSIKKNAQLMIKIAKTDITKNSVAVEVKGFRFEPSNNLLSAHGSLTAPVAQVAPEAIEAYTLTPSWAPVANADYYEIEFNGLNYTNIRSNSLIFEDLQPETDYTFKVRAVNADGASPWTEVNVRTKNNPLEFAIRGIQGEVNVPVQAGFGVSRLFDFAESGDTWHTKYRANAIPFDLTIDLMSVNTLDRFDYLPRQDGGNGTILKGSVAVSMDKEHWTEVDSFTWKRNGDVKSFLFSERPTARYIRLSVTEGVGNYGSGREIYVFKVPGTESYLPGDINNDGKIDENDLMSYTNYTGLRTVDSDFDYVSAGDINRNGLIDAYDISAVATRLEDGVEPNDYAKPLAGSIEMEIPKGIVAKGDTVSITVKGVDLESVNAISFALPYDQQKWEFAGIEPVAVKGMENLTNDRLHSNNVKALYPTFVNIGDKPDVSGNETLFIIRFVARQKGTFNSKMQDAMIVDKKLTTIKL